MGFGKKKLLASFLEKDNVKLLAYEVSGSNVTRLFGGQVTFSEDTLRDAFISDPVKFSTQVKSVISQKTPLTEVTEGILFVHADKSFLKALNASESVDVFVRSLPFFKEELVILPPDLRNGGGADQDNKVNYLAFEKKLVEDFERPFLETGKKILSVNSSILELAKKYTQSGRYLLILPFEKDVTVAACQDGVILDLTTFAKDVWVGRLSEFRMGKGFSDIMNVFVVSSLELGVADKLRNEQQLNVTELGGGDLYDLAVSAVLGGSGSKKDAGSGTPKTPIPKVSLPKIPGLKWVFLVLAGVVGFAIVFLILKNFGGVGGLTGNLGSATPTPKPTEAVINVPSPTPSPKPEDFKVIVLNGTTVAGEAAAFGEVLTKQGFNVIETANATTSGFAATRLMTDTTVPESIIDSLKTTILDTYKSVSLEPLATSAAQIQIIIGEKK